MAVQKPWLNLHFIEKILRNSENDNSIKVIDIFSEQATVTGDNYGSKIIRIIAKFTHNQDGYKITEEKSMICKILPTDCSHQNFILEIEKMFQVEISMMLDTLEKMNKLLWPKYRLSAKALYAQKEKPIYLVAEDLKSLGFRLAEREIGLDLTHCMLAIRGLARFHAASVAVCEKEPEQKKKYSRGIFHKDSSEDAKSYFLKSTTDAADEIAHWPEMKKYSEKIRKLSENICKIGMDAVKLNEDEFNVINHGDYWINNMMFKYDKDDRPIEHIFLDFQLCIYTSPAIDLHYFLNTSPSANITEDERNILLNEYSSTLTSTMKQLHCKTQPPTLEELEIALKHRASYGMIATFSVLPIVLCSKTEATNLDGLFNTVSPGLKTKNYKILLMQRLPIYDKLGLLDL